MKPLLAAAQKVDRAATRYRKRAKTLDPLKEEATVALREFRDLARQLADA